MVYDFTRGKKPRYLLILHNWQVEDKIYYHYYREAKEKFDELKEQYTRWESMSIYDMDKDIRKDYHRN